jgi:hypothetical protein
MPVVAITPKRFNLPTEGTYRATLTDVTDLGCHPDLDHPGKEIHEVELEFELEGSKLHASYTARFSPRNKAFAKSLARRVGPRVQRVELLIGTMCQIDIVHQGDRGEAWLRVTDVRSLDPERGDWISAGIIASWV